MGDIVPTVPLSGINAGINIDESTRLSNNGATTVTPPDRKTAKYLALKYIFFSTLVHTFMIYPLFISSKNELPKGRTAKRGRIR